MVDGNQKVYEIKNWIYARQTSAFRKKKILFNIFQVKIGKKKLRLPQKIILIF